MPGSGAWIESLRRRGLSDDASVRRHGAFTLPQAVEFAIGLGAVGPIISVPATGQLIVGGSKPQSINRLATSSTEMPADLAKGRTTTMHSCATRASAPA